MWFVYFTDIDTDDDNDDGVDDDDDIRTSFEMGSGICKAMKLKHIHNCDQ